MPVSTQVLDSIAEARHHSPHDVLGAHPSPEGVAVRCIEPRATDVKVVVGKKKTAMVRLHEGGIWEAVFPKKKEVFPYLLEVTGEWGTATRDDPYRFLPTLGDQDLYYVAEGKHYRLHERLGCHKRSLGGVEGYSFAVWAPNAQAVRVIGDWNGWNTRVHQMRILGASGIWEIFIPGLHPGLKYKFSIRTQGGREIRKVDPFAFAAEVRPRTNSVVHDLGKFSWGDGAWMESVGAADPYRKPMSVYEMHLGSWRRNEDGSWLGYHALTERLVPYLQEMGFTHVEFMPPNEHPLDSSWGYQVTGYFAPTSRFGPPDDFKHLVDRLHRAGIGVIIDWVPAHFPRDAWALGHYDGTALFEHEDWRKGAHPDWGTLIFNYGRREVANFLLTAGLFWIDEYHVDGLRTDAVASMLYLDYSRKHGEWVPNMYGGRENLEAIHFIREMNKSVYRARPGAFTVAEESTAWPGVSRPAHLGGLGFGFKWNMGWMHDILEYFKKDPVHRRYHHGSLTFAMLYAFHENFIMSLSHDEVVHGKRSLIGKMPGDDWQKFANLRLLYAYMWAQPGKKLLFMGGEFGQWREWHEDRQLDWHLLEREPHRGVRDCVRDLNHLYRDLGALHERDHDPRGFEWIDYSDSDQSVVSFIRRGESPDDFVVCVFNFTPLPRWDYLVGVPEAGYYREIFNSDAAPYGGANMGNAGGDWTRPHPHHNRPHSLRLLLPPLSAVFLKLDRG